MVGLRAADVVDVLVTVGDLGHAIGDAAATSMEDGALLMVHSDREAVDFLRDALRPNDLVLVKGSRAVGMDAIVADILLVPDQRPAK
jgi:UDP-N-acetylmuramoyl-tripeptide--D-alanyl-D-alanine ligase